MQPNVRIEVAHDKWEPIRLHLKSMKLRHGPFHRNWKVYTVELELTENQLLMLQLHGDIIIHHLQKTIK